MIWVCASVLTVLGALLMWYGAEAFDQGFYSDRAGFAWIGTVGFLFGLFAFAAAIWPDAVRYLLIGY
jgi:hypothetical protein